jgi:geranylgeranyl diphosphate synthase type II
MGTLLKKVIKTAAAMQISEDWLLIHDDIEDNSNVRRAKPTLHKLYGTELAINAGDALQVIMWRVLFDNFNLVGQESSIKILEEFYQILSRTILGQGIEINKAKSQKFSFTDDDWYFISDGKTSYYTIAGPMRLGAILAGADKKQLEILSVFGQALGRSFQLVDDILDLTAKDYKGLGQSMGNDIYESKRTVMFGHVLSKANKKDKKKLIAIFSKDRNNKNDADVKWAIERMHYYGSIDYGKQLALKLKQKALQIFENDLKFLSRQPHRKNLRHLIDFIIEREY